MSKPIAAGSPLNSVTTSAFTRAIVNTRSSTGSMKRARTAAGIVINPAAFTHTSVAILDALNTFEQPVIEVHISNVHKREAFRHHSFVSHRADGVIAGLGTEGYQLAIRRVASLITSAEKKR